MNGNLSWVRLPSEWITAGGLKSFSWKNGGGANETAALMTLIGLAHRADQTTGVALATYDDLTEALSISRAKVSDGLDILSERRLITRQVDGRSSFKLENFDPLRGWAILPRKSLYREKRIEAFKDFHLRKLVELDALKLYLLIVAGRDRDRNRAFISYPKIEEMAAIPTNRIKSALSLLVVNNLVYAEQNIRDTVGVVQSYRLPQIEPRRHAGTVGRGELNVEPADFNAADPSDGPF